MRPVRDHRCRTSFFIFLKKVTTRHMSDADASRQKARPFPRPMKLVAGVLADLVCKISLIWAIVAVAKIGLRFSEAHSEALQKYKFLWGMHFLGAIFLFVVFRIILMIIGKSTRCPLCHGYPLHEQKSTKSKGATKFPLLSYRTSTVISLLFTGKYNCMYCGTPFRLKQRQPGESGLHG
jgi:hypothetical protein